MTLTALAAVPPDTFTDEDLEMARVASRAVARLNGRGAVRVDAVADREPRQTFVLPAVAVRMLTEMLTHLGEGRSVAVMPADAELTTQQAADMLNVSRPYLIRLLDERRLPHHMAGTHRRVKLNDLIAYRAERDARSQAARQQLVEEAQELDMGY